MDQRNRGGRSLILYAVLVGYNPVSGGGTDPSIDMERKLTKVAKAV